MNAPLPTEAILPGTPILAPSEPPVLDEIQYEHDVSQTDQKSHSTAKSSLVAQHIAPEGFGEWHIYVSHQQFRSPLGPECIFDEPNDYW